MDARWVILLTDRHTYAARFERSQRRWNRTVTHEIALELPVWPRDEEDLTSTAETLAKELRKHESNQMICRLVIPSSWCLNHSVELPSTKWNEQAAEYEFEQYLPVDLEALTCATHRVGRRRALVAGVFTDALQGLLATLESHGIYPEVVTVDNFLLANSASTDNGAQCKGHLLLDEQRMTLSVMDEPSSASDDPRTVKLPEMQRTQFVRRQMALTAAMSGGELCHWRINSLADSDSFPGMEEAMPPHDEAPEIQPRSETVDAMLEAAATNPHLSNLRKGALAYAGRWSKLRRRAIQCLSAAAVLLLILGVRLRMDNVAHHNAADRLRSLQSEIYQAVFPGSVVPAAAMRLRSERIKLEGMTNQRGEGKDNLNTSGLVAFELLHEVMVRVPDNMKLFVQQIELDARGIRLSGQTTSHSAAGDLVKAIGNVQGMAVDPPRTKLRKDGTVDFRIRATKLIEHD